MRLVEEEDEEEEDADMYFAPSSSISCVRGTPGLGSPDILENIAIVSGRMKEGHLEAAGHRAQMREARCDIFSAVTSLVPLEVVSVKNGEPPPATMLPPPPPGMRPA